MEYRLTEMRKEHIAQIAELEKLCFSDPWNEAALLPELSNPLSVWLVAEQKGRVLGYIGSQTVLDETDLMNLAVSPDCRRQGLASALLRALSDAVRQRGAEFLTLEVRCGNRAAISLYESMGFYQIGRRPGYYFHPREDALIFRKELHL